jgi:hypothetical protein
VCVVLSLVRFASQSRTVGQRLGTWEDNFPPLLDDGTHIIHYIHVDVPGRHGAPGLGGYLEAESKSTLGLLKTGWEWKRGRGPLYSDWLSQ